MNQEWQDRQAPGADSTAALAQLAADRPLLGRTSMVARVEDVLRERIIEGLLPPGTRLPEQAIGAALGISRNTLREALRLLSHERLVVHELNRGAFVRTPTRADVTDLYRARRVIESASIRHAEGAGQSALLDMQQAVESAERAADEGRWAEVGTANLRFHQGIAALAGSERVNHTMRQYSAEMRLVFHVMGRPREFHEPFLAGNREILTLLQAGDIEHAHDHLMTYLDDAERRLLDAY